MGCQYRQKTPPLHRFSSIEWRYGDRNAQPHRSLESPTSGEYGCWSAPAHRAGPSHSSPWPACPYGHRRPDQALRLDRVAGDHMGMRSEEHTSELQSRPHLVCRLLLEKKKKKAEKRIQTTHLRLMRLRWSRM